MPTRPACGLPRIVHVACVLLVAMVAFLPGCGSARKLEGVRFEPALRWWRAPMRGDLEITQGGVPGSGSKIDVEDDLGLERENHFGLTGDLYWGLHRFQLGFQPLGFDGNQTLASAIRFRGQLFSAGEDVDTEISLDTWTLRYDYPVLGTPDNGFRLGASAYWWQFEAELKSRTTLSEAERDFSRLLPGAHLAGTQSFGVAQLRFLGAAAFLDEGRRLFELDGQIEVPLHKLGLPLEGFLGGGYRYLQYCLDEDTNHGDLEMMGPFAELRLRF